jgi:hypothetical protein
MRRAPLRTLAVVAILAASTAGSAVAYWKGAGHGSTEIRLRDPQPLVLSPGAQSALLYPGGDTGVAVDVTNANPYAVHIGSLSVDTSSGTNGFDVDAQHSGCGLAPLGFVPQDDDALGWTVPPKSGDEDGSIAIHLEDALTMDMTAADACQGAAFTVHLIVGS